MPEDIGAGPQPPSTELQGLTPEQNQEALDLKHEADLTADIHKASEANVKSSEAREEIQNRTLSEIIELRVQGGTEEQMRSLAVVEQMLRDKYAQNYSLKDQQAHARDTANAAELAELRAKDFYHKNEKAVKEQTIKDAHDVGVEISYPSYTDSQETAQKKAEALAATKEVDDLRAKRQQLGHEINFGNLNDAQRTEAQAEHDRLSAKLTEASDRLSRLGHEVGVAEAVAQHGPGVIVPPEDSAEVPYKHAGKTPEQVFAETRAETERMRAELAAQERQNFGDLRNALTDEQAEQFHAPLGRQIRGETSMSLEELQALRATLTQSQLDQFGSFLDKKIGDLEYEEKKARNLASGRSASIGGPEGVSSSDKPPFPSVINPDSEAPGAPDSPIS